MKLGSLGCGCHKWLVGTHKTWVLDSTCLHNCKPVSTTCLIYDRTNQISLALLGLHVWSCDVKRETCDCKVSHGMLLSSGVLCEKVSGPVYIYLHGTLGLLLGYRFGVCGSSLPSQTIGRVLHILAS